MKKLILIILAVVIVLAAIAVMRDQIIKTVITVTVSRITGAPVHVGGFSLGVFRQSVKISGFKMYNPQGFSKDILINIPKIEVHYDLQSILKGKLHLYNVEMELKEIGLEKNKEGRLNVDSLKVSGGEKEAREKEKSKPLAMEIELLNLRIGRIVSREYASGKEPLVKVHEINLKKTYKNITSAEQLVLLILSEPMKQAGIKGAKIYGAALLTGVGMLPVAIVSKFIAKDSVQQDLNVPFDKLYLASSSVLKRIGKIEKESSSKGTILVNVEGTSVSVKLKALSQKSTQITVSARKHLLPRPEIAGGVLYQISEEVK